MTKFAINGFGRIGRISTRVWLSRPDLQSSLDLVAINTSGSMEIDGWAHVLKYDTSYGVLPHDVGVEKVRSIKETTDQDPLLGYIHIIGKKIPVLAQRDPEKIPWAQYEVDVVIESTGAFEDEDKAGKHLKAGAKKVVISAPSKGGSIKTHVLGVNQYNGTDQIADNASCTTNCIAPVVAIMHEAIGVKKAALTTVHAYTDDQNLQDGSHKKDLRRARAAGRNIVPTSTGAAKATTEVVPELAGLFDGIALRVPVTTGSLSDITFVTNRPTSVEEVNQAIKDASSQERWKGIVAWTQEPIVSGDIIGRSESTIVDLSLTQVIDGDLVKILTWYDNEWGYSSRLVEQVREVGK